MEEKKKVNLQEACKLFGITDKWYRALAKEGHVPVPVKNQIQFVYATRDIVKYYRNLAQGQGSMSLIDERTKLTHRQSEKLGLELQNMKGDLVHIESVEKVVEVAILGFKARLLSMPAKLAPVVIGLTAPEVQEVISKAVIDVLEELSQIDYAELKRRKEDMAPDKKDVKATRKNAGKRVGRPKKNVKPRSKRGTRKVANGKG